MKFTINLFLILGLVSCANFSQYQEAYKNLWDVYFDTSQVSKELYLKSPYSFMTFKFANQKKALLVLVSFKDGLAHWISEDEVSIYTLKGKIIKTKGLMHDIEFSHNFDPLNINSNAFEINFKDPMLLNQLATSKITNNGTKEIIYLDENINIDVYEERVKLNAIHESFNNSYFLYDQKVIYSKQKIHPFLAEIELRFFFK